MSMNALVYDYIHDISSDLNSLRAWLTGYELLGDFGGICLSCHTGTVLLRKDVSFSQHVYYWRCNNKSCGKKLSIRKDSWFSASHLSL